jgi:hypothetical protein
MLPPTDPTAGRQWGEITGRPARDILTDLSKQFWRQRSQSLLQPIPFRRSEQGYFSESLATTVATQAALPIGIVVLDGMYACINIGMELSECVHLGIWLYNVNGALIYGLAK